MFAVKLDSVFHLFQFTARHMMDRAASGDAFGRLAATSSPRWTRRREVTATDSITGISRR
jgi:hypothetical protein